MSEHQIPPTAEAAMNSAPNALVSMATSAANDLAATRKNLFLQPVFLLACLAALALLFVFQWWALQGQIGTLREEVARRLHDADVVTTETKLVAKSVVDASKEVQAKVTILEAKQSEAQSQQLALEQLYQDLSKNRDEWALAEIEQVLATASQQLQLAGNVQGALIALQNADGRLAKSDKPQFITIRRALAKDIEKLKILPALDLTGIALRLDSVIAQIDHIPLWADEKSVVTTVAPKAPLRILPKASGKTKEGDKVVSNESDFSFTARAQDAWQSFSSEMWSDVRQLIRVRNVESPDALLLAPSQAYFARENLKLRLLNARLALLSRNEGAFRSDLIAAQDSLNKYFDARTKQAQTVQALLRQVQSSNLSIEMPSLSDSLNAVRNYKVKP